MSVRIKTKSLIEILKTRNIQPGGEVQKKIDSEVLRHCSRYAPKLSGELIKSGTRNTVIGSGKVIYKTPYAKSQYYYNTGHGKQGIANGGLRGRKWFERMKKNNLRRIIRVAVDLSGGREGPHG